MQENHTFLQIHPEDNVLVALQDLSAGSLIRLNGNSFPLQEHISAKHKFTIHPLSPGDNIYMYGVLVGKADQHIPQGGAVTVHNIHHATQEFDLRERKLEWVRPNVSHWNDKKFMGYHRPDGSVGTANFWVVIPLVFCENRNVEVLKDALIEKLGYSKVKAFETDVDRLIDLYTTGADVEQVLEIEWKKPMLKREKIGCFLM